MAQVIWTARAANEITEVAEFIGDFSVSYAKQFVSRAYERTGQLASFPEMGRMIPEINKSQYRELLEGNYRIMYELLDTDLVLIQRVIHQSRNFKP
ncbi:type II toxin-antitoxin system RelE/ParE family toxin [Fibrella sp. HMF5335]|uniref:Type II toxin-antitoxin system RelE/ParE family toxin n=1 Tax=Fibrella rubiginis TaxID=2817060 RepID=A0A939K3W9_9BACT|nr:type II toxin-antitoxin system RelE/ParE family toxin [Fibrella rubiginis]MBO0936068.1 type II toxin-antitoxin system RelE/ParE family toxin [Fibrella rubiginis]